LALAIAVLACWIVSVPGAVLAEAGPHRPSLVVQITIDGLPAEMVSRFEPRFGEGGFRHLLDHGVHYTAARYQHATTFTAVGHATLFTGGHTADHGIPGNDWRDPRTGRHVYTVQDDDSPVLGPDGRLEIGRSPRNLTSTTTGDQLILAQAGAARVFSVSGKDRGAIIPGGHLGKAIWYDDDLGAFVTSTWYYDEPPAWLADWNRAGHISAYRDRAWELPASGAPFLYADRDDRPCEKGHAYLGQTFPHSLRAERETDFFAALPYTPFLDELVLDLAVRILETQRLGQGPAVDMLAVSFSSTDYIHHAWGVHSLEAEANLLQLDATLAGFFSAIDRNVGLDHALIVLSADHGFDDAPECRQESGLDMGRHRPDRFIASANAALRARFGTDRDLVVAFWNPSLYLDTRAISEMGVDPAEVERALAEHMRSVPGFAWAVTRTDLLTGCLPDIPIMRQLQLSFHPQRSGNVLVVQEPFRYLYPKPDVYAAMHGSPYAYDTHVPILFAGPGMRHQRAARAVAPADIAPTIAAYLGIQPPSGSTGTPLVEILDASDR
jgi:predicted AlkP superfamily pyrophosphatase or phosphodiesterase